MTSKASIFDVDGTLVDSVAIHAKTWQEAFREFGHEIAFEELLGQIGEGGDQLMPVFLSKAEFEAKGDAISRRRADILKSKYLSKIEPFRQVRALFQRVRDDDFKIVLASSAEGEQLETYKLKARIEDLCEYETSSDDVERPSPTVTFFKQRSIGSTASHQRRRSLSAIRPTMPKLQRRLGFEQSVCCVAAFPKRNCARPAALLCTKTPPTCLAHYDQMIQDVATKWEST